jgi:tRNA nucleotidyltransferase (CCA-adding enzyme)
MVVKTPPFVQKIIETLEKEGYEIYIVGGVVRDILLGREAVDWDFTTNAHPEIILSLLPKAFYDNRFGTVGVTDPKEEKKKTYYGKSPVYEITTFRKEIGYSDLRHPDKVVWGKTIEEDLERRDFTINAMALKPITNDKWQMTNFKLIDPHGGQKDIEAELIRAVGDPKTRFQEDALRLMRAIRIATQLKFTIEPKTFKAIQSNASLISKISAERIRDELLKLLSYKYAADGYLLLRTSGLAKIILPEIEAGFGVDQKSPMRHHIYDVGTHSVESLRNSTSLDPIVNLAILLHDVGKPIVFHKDKDGLITFYNHEVVGASIARNIGRRLRLSKKDKERLFNLVRWHQFTVDERQTDSAVRRFIRNVGKENLADILEVRRADRLGGGARDTSWRLELFKQKLVEVQKQPFSVNDLKVDGNDVMKILNITPGPAVGKVLNQLFAEVEDNKRKNKRGLLLKRLKEIKKTFSF